VGTDVAGRYIYWDNYYHDLYTNRHVLMVIGWRVDRESGLSRYWLSPKYDSIGYRHLKVDNKLIPNRGTINDGSVRADFWIRPTLGVSAFVQYEQWRFPLLAAGLQKNVTASIQFSYWPQSHSH
jgi:hypothetical protein